MVEMNRISSSGLRITKDGDKWYQDYENLWDLKDYNPAQDLLYIGTEVVTGGMRGGNCWGGNPSSFVETEQFDYESFFMSLDSLGFISLDDMSIKQLFKLKSKMIQKDREINAQSRKNKAVDNYIDMLSKIYNPPYVDKRVWREPKKMR